MTKAQQKDRDEAIAELRGMLRPGQTVYTILRHCSRSGMQRVIDLVILDQHGDNPTWHIGGLAARAMGDRFDRKREGIVAGGCGMDMGFHLVYNLSATLFRGGFGCIGEGCPSNDHSNGDRDYTPHYDGTPRDASEVGKDLKPHRHYHMSGGYALKHRWL